MAYWMGRVVKERNRVGRGFEPKPVHDLRVALRRCRSLAAGISRFDPHPDLKHMRKAAKKLLGGLGGLRDLQVMRQWVEKLSQPNDALGLMLMGFSEGREHEVRKEAWDALEEFDRRQWKEWRKTLPPRASRVSLDSPVYELLAVERWNEAYLLHRRASRSRSKVALHRLRIAIKRFRYTVENFLPRRHAEWGRTLKELQDLLGEVHDLDVLWAVVRLLKNAADQERIQWRGEIERQRGQRIERYREQMAGRKSLWHQWRAALPEGEALDSAAIKLLGTWASCLDPEYEHAQHVSKLALALFDGLARAGLGLRDSHPRLRTILHGAALTHDVGRAEGEKRHPKASYRMIRKLDPPPGWTAEEMQVVALAARYHLTDMPSLRQKGFGELRTGQQQEVLFLSAVLRLANAFDYGHSSKVKRLEVKAESGAIEILAEGYTRQDPMATRLAATRHLLEIVCRRPVLILPLPVPA